MRHNSNQRTRILCAFSVEHYQIFKYYWNWPLRGLTLYSSMLRENYWCAINLMNGWNNERKIVMILLTKLKQMPYYFPLSYHKNNILNFNYNILTDFTRIDLRLEHILEQNWRDKPLLLPIMQWRTHLFHVLCFEDETYFKGGRL